MSFELQTLKEALGDKFGALETYVTDLEGQRDAARQESITGRKALKAENESLKASKTRLMEKLGVDSDEDIDALPDAKGQAEAAKQYESQIKKLQRELDERTKGLADVSTRFRDAQVSAQLEKALSGHEWVDRETAALIARQSIIWEGDDLYFAAGEKRVSLVDGAKLIAAAKPHLLKAQGAGGSGYTGAGGTGAKPVKAPVRKDYADEVSFFKAAAAFNAQPA